MFLDTATAGHEAAHVVVGLALGLRLKRATIRPSARGRELLLGYAHFYSDRKYLAQAIMLCAGAVWDRRNGFEPDATPGGDLGQAHKLVTRADVLTCLQIAGEILDGRRRAHARLASELCDRDLTTADVEALVLDL